MGIKLSGTSVGTLTPGLYQHGVQLGVALLAILFYEDTLWYGRRLVEVLRRPVFVGRYGVPVLSVRAYSLTCLARVSRGYLLFCHCPSVRQIRFAHCRLRRMGSGGRPCYLTYG